ncbi:hypothetical protein [Bartonella quintana]|uniref:Phage protein n=3 Tax=Bartonella quintana TaxID=803 RepID=A0A0H3LV35_BARQU|nr:hypothetical protein [Bartonella quintana]ETS12145.1 hypothetical protein Q651_00886 [Bartonella quintana BQ2-D70]ETS15158.1 hypothetical protein Q650_00030 [Bartonella quintana JK 73rel]ETS17450.1 hypothetical protein Q649_00030 [Bartonella quintana JK 73]ETS17485.1 hypothetical protein Q648_00887 [Bartonella quintana JK 12]ETS19543.1 hypothetical protein Q647_00030 [Bartonella quintana JK 7]
MDQEHLTPAEQNQLKQDFLSTTQEEEDCKFAQGEKTLGANFEGRQQIDQQQPAQPESGQSQDVQKVLEAEAPPDPQKDFMGYMQWLGKTLHQQGLLHTKQQVTSKVPEAEQLHAFYQQSVGAVKQKHHDFDQAADFIYETRARQLAACATLYPEMADPKVVDAVIGHELKQILQVCAQKNQNPAEVIYDIAKKIGYTNAPNNISENFQERHNSARTLAAYNGLAPNGPISLDMLDKMSEAEFSTWITDPKNKAAFNRLMGGGEL